MKKFTILAVCFVFIASFCAGCASRGEGITALDAPNSVNETEALLAELGTDAVPQETNNSLFETEYSEQENTNAIVTDLDTQPTALNIDPDFEEFVDMLYMNPENYLGMTVTVNGEYMGYFDDYLDRYTHFVYKWDEMGCCPLLMEFMLDDDISPEDFAKDDSQIEISGVYSSYDDKDFDWKHYYIDVDTLSILSGGAS